MKRKINLVALAVAATLPLVSMEARAGELDDLKAQVKELMKRIEDLEAKQAAAPPPAPPPPVVVAAPPPPPPVNPALRTDVSGVGFDPQSEPIIIYQRGNGSVMLYGLIEPTLSHVNHQTPTGGYATGYQVSWFSGNRLGFDFQHVLDPTNDFGFPGLKIIAKLETEYELPTGNMDTDNVFFNRDAWAGAYAESLGKLTFGRQNTLTRDFTNNWGDPYSGSAETTLREGGYTNVNNFKQLIFYSGGPNGTRYNSAIEWKKKWGDHWVTGLAYKFGSGGNGGSGDVGTGGSLPGDFTNGTAAAASVAYNDLALGADVRANVNANYNEGNVNHNISQSALFGGNVTFGPFRINSGYIRYTAQQGPNNSIGRRTDNAWTVSGTYVWDKTEFAVGYQEYKGSNAGFNSGGRIINPFGNTSGVTMTAGGGKPTVYGSIVYHLDRQLDLYVAADYFWVTGQWVVGDGLGNGLSYGKGQPYSNETELAVGARFRF